MTSLKRSPIHFHLVFTRGDLYMYLYLFGSPCAWLRLKMLVGHLSIDLCGTHLSVQRAAISGTLLQLYKRTWAQLIIIRLLLRTSCWVLLWLGQNPALLPAKLHPPILESYQNPNVLSMPRFYRYRRLMQEAVHLQEHRESHDFNAR